MQIVIEIPNKDIPKRQEVIDISLHFIDGKVCEAGGYGFDVLPKGHGDLIDRNELLKHYDSTTYHNGIEERKLHFVQIGYVNDAPTIIEADTESEDEE